MQQKSIWTKLPLAMLVAAILFAATGTAAQQNEDPPLSVVEQALDASFNDVGIPPIAETVAFWKARTDADPADYLSRVRLARAVMTLAQQTGDLSQYDVAEQILGEALALNPRGTDATLALGAAKAANHDFRGSLDLARQVLAREPGSDAARLAIADDNFELGNYDEARRELAKLAATSPEDIGIVSRQAKQASIQGRNDVAVTLAAQAVVAAADLDMGRSEAAFYRFQLAYFLHRAGRIGEALDAVDRGLAIDPGHRASKELRAQILVSLGRLYDAATAYEAILSVSPAADLHGALAKVYRALGRGADANAELAKGRELGRAQLGLYPAERRHLAGFFADVEPATALTAALADFDTRRDVGAYDTLAWAYYRTGQTAEAARYVTGALGQGTRDATLLYHAGMISAAVGQKARAVENLRSALELNPNFDLEGAPIARATLAELES